MCKSVEGKTHVLGGMAFGLGSYLAMKETGILVAGVPDIAQLGVMLPYAIWGSTFPDLDQENHQKAEDNPINLVFQKVFKAFGVKHRGAGSHVIPALAATAASGVLWWWMQIGKVPISIASTIGLLVCIGFACGVVSHLILDCFTMAGVHGIGGKPVIRFVPHNSIFGTGTPYEMVWRKFLYVIDVILLVMVFIV